MSASAKSIEAESIKRVRRLVLSHLSSEDVRIYFFGSRARGESQPGSDIDVGILPASELQCGSLATLREALEDLAVPYRVDIVNLAETTETFRKHALEEATLWRS